jgi:hypothetical protein
MVYVDRRLGGVTRYYQTPPVGWLMRVPPEILKSVVFIGHDVPMKRGKGTVPRFEGTGFLVEVRGDSLPELGFTYLVTAGHVADAVEGNFWVRQNIKGAGAERVPGGDEPFVRHPTDPTADVAVLPWEIAPALDQVALPLPMFYADPETMRLNEIGVGDEVFMAGVFPSAVGRQRNTPIVRKGNLAMLPEGKIEIKGPKLIDAYLIEAHSVGGMSGAPVFVRHTAQVGMDLLPEKPGDPPSRVIIHGAGEHFLFGLMHGHWEIEADDMNEVHIRAPRKGEQTVNYGISIVVPASKIMEALNAPELVRARKADEDEHRSDQGLPIPDTASEGRGPQPGQEPERLKIDKTMDEAVRTMFRAGKPAKD